MSASDGTSKKTYAQVAASQSQSDESNGSEMGESDGLAKQAKHKEEPSGEGESSLTDQSAEETHGADLSKSADQSGSTDSDSLVNYEHEVVNYEPDELLNLSLYGSKSAENVKALREQGPKEELSNNTVEDFIPQKKTTMLTEEEKGGAEKEDERSEGELEVISEEMEKKRMQRRKTIKFVGGVLVGFIIVGAIWWVVKRRSNRG